MNKLLDFRAKAGLSQSELAELVTLPDGAHISKQTIFNLENGKSDGFGTTQIHIEDALEAHRYEHGWSDKPIERGDIFPDLLTKQLREAEHE